LTGDVISEKDEEKLNNRHDKGHLVFLENPVITRPTTQIRLRSEGYADPALLILTHNIQEKLMKIGFIGYGSMAKALSARWSPHHDVYIGGRDLERAAALAEAIEASGSGSVAEAVTFGDVVVMATPAGAVEHAIEQAGGAAAFEGKVVLDINNPVSVPGGPHDQSGIPYLPHAFPEGSLSERIAALLPGSQVVKAFNMSQASVWEMDPPNFDGRKLVTLYCGGDEQAKEVVHGLIESLGCEAVDLGDLCYARLLEAAACIVIKCLFEGHDLKTVLNLIQPEVKPV